MKHWNPPEGPVNAQTRPWTEYRANVRAAAQRWCDKPKAVHQEPEVEIFEACGDCAACEASELVLAGKA